MSFSQNLIKLQQENNESNYRLAKSLGVHASTVQNWRDGRMPQIEHASRVPLVKCLTGCMMHPMMMFN